MGNREAKMLAAKTKKRSRKDLFMEICLFIGLNPYA
jgi:hypothetical protein